MSGFDPGAYLGSAYYYTLTTRPPQFYCKMMILFKYYDENPTQNRS